MTCSSSRLSAHGHDRGTGRRGTHHAPLARSASLAANQRSRAVVTVVGEHPMRRATWRAFSPASRRATISRFARGPNRHLPSVMSGPPSEPSVVATESFRRGPDNSSQPFSRSVSSSASRSQLTPRGAVAVRLVLMTVYLEREGNLIEMTKRSYAAEDLLQTLIATHPDLLAGEEDSDERNRWVLIEREVPVADRPDAAGRWSLDHLFVDQDGVPTLVEVKRSSDTRIRREVVGQMLEYAANGPRYWPLGSVRGQFEARCSGDGEDPNDVLHRTFGETLDVETWWTAVETNLRDGTLRLLFV